MCLELLMTYYLSCLCQFAFHSDVLCQYVFHLVQIVILMFPTIDSVISSHYLGGCESIWLNLFTYHLLYSDTVNRGLWHMINGWFQMTYALSFVECDMFVCIIGYKNM